MPIFEYECSCKNVFEKLVMNTSKKIKPVCPKCGSTKTKKLISDVAHFSISGYKASNGYSKRGQTDEEIIKKGPEQAIKDMKNSF